MVRIQTHRVAVEELYHYRGRCTRCGTPLELTECHIDHKRSGKRGTNHDSNLRTLCRRCHVLMADHRHRCMTAGALRDGIIPPDGRKLVWEDQDGAWLD